MMANARVRVEEYLDVNNTDDSVTHKGSVVERLRLSKLWPTSGSARSTRRVFKGHKKALFWKVCTRPDLWSHD